MNKRVICNITLFKLKIRKGSSFKKLKVRGIKSVSPRFQIGIGYERGIKSPILKFR